MITENRMKKLGYLISPIKLRDVADFIELTDDISKFDTDRPAIIIGLETARSKIKNFSILNKKYGDNKFWTFGKTERRVDFDKDIMKFYDYVLSKSIETIKYIYVDPLTLSHKRIKGMVKFFMSSDVKYLYIYKEMLYVYYGKNIFGLSLTLLNYCGVNTKKWLNKIIKNKSVKLFYNDTKISNYIKHYAKNKKYLIPYFFSLMDE